VIALSVPCSVCGAEPEQSCVAPQRLITPVSPAMRRRLGAACIMTTTGELQPRKPHVARVNAAKKAQP
jgi:hypothetical protein